jgi:hypothetical protein
MKSKMLVELNRLNTTLRRDAWINYKRFLGIVLRSNSLPAAKVGLEFLLNEDFNGLLKWADGISTTAFTSVTEHRLHRQLAAIVRKYPFPQTVVSTDPRGEAIKKFLSSEHRCKRVNKRFFCYRKVRSPNESRLSLARDYISYVLGEVKLAEIWEHCAFGAGASLGIHGNCTNFARKLLSERWTVTPSAYYYARASLKDDIHIFEAVVKPNEGMPFFSVDPDLFNDRFGEKALVVEHNKISFVPKDATTHRAIATEPLLNGYLQKGIDVVMRKRLKRVGIDLSDQRSNQAWAQKGSLRGDDADGLATIDLSSASDSISIELCRFLLPPDWFDLLNSVRSHRYKLNGEFHTYHKFTSMGNGFCFPLESLIFASLCHAASSDVKSKDKFLVYGDDIIVSNTVFRPLLDLLSICGFKVNSKKTFSTGPFRESCGADWFEGEDVRPIILDFAFDSFESIAKFWNGTKSKYSWNAIFSEACEFLASLIPKNLFLCRPVKGNPDSCFEVPWDVFMGSAFARFSRNTQSWSWLEYMRTAKADNKARALPGYNVALIASAVRGALSSSPFSERFTARTNVRRVGQVDSESSGLIAAWWLTTTVLHGAGTTRRWGDRFYAQRPPQWRVAIP